MGKVMSIKLTKLASLLAGLLFATAATAQTTYTDISMSYRGIELSGVTPYSGHFAG